MQSFLLLALLGSWGLDYRATNGTVSSWRNLDDAIAPSALLAMLNTVPALNGRVGVNLWAGIPGTLGLMPGSVHGGQFVIYGKQLGASAGNIAFYVPSNSTSFNLEGGSIVASAGGTNPALLGTLTNYAPQVSYPWGDKISCGGLASGTSGSPPSLSSLISCCMDSISVYGSFASAIALGVPLLLAVIGIIGVMDLVAKLVHRGMGGTAGVHFAEADAGENLEQFTEEEVARPAWLKGRKGRKSRFAKGALEADSEQTRHPAPRGGLGSI